MFSSMSIGAIWNFNLGRSKAKVTQAPQVVLGQPSSFIKEINGTN